MRSSEFLDEIYGSIEVGTKIRKPKKMSEVLRITENGHIYYRIGSANQKAVTRKELLAVFGVLDAEGFVSKAQIREIATRAKPCNVTTIEWLLLNAGVAKQEEPGGMTRAW